MSHPAWRECVVTAVLALLLWLVVALTGGGDRRGDLGPLFGAAPERIAVAWGDQGYQLELDATRPRLFDRQGELLGRAWQREAGSIARALASVRVLRRLQSEDDRDWAEYGLDRPLELTIAGRTHLLGGVGIDRGYARVDDELLILDQDLEALLRRPPAVLRTPTLDLVGAHTVTHSRGWRLDQVGERWWLHLNADDERRWTDHELVDQYLSALTSAAVVGFAPMAGERPARGSLRFARDGGLPAVTLEDLGPADVADNRLLRRSEDGIAEHLVVALDALLLDPDPRRFATTRLLPLDPLQASELRIGEVVLRRHDAGWSVDGQRDVDRGRIARLLERLASWERPEPMPPAGDRVLIALRSDALRFELRARDPRAIELVRQLGAHHLRDRRLLPELEPDAITDLIIQPREGAPDIYTREDGEWPAAERAAVEGFIAALLAARVEEWRGPLGPDDGHEHYDSTVTLAAGATQHTLRLRADGMVAVLDRDLAGLLDADSRRQVLAE